MDIRDLKKLEGRKVAAVVEEDVEGSIYLFFDDMSALRWLTENTSRTVFA